MAAEAAGFSTVAFCEIDEYCRTVLRERYPSVPIWRDVHDFSAQALREAGIGGIDLLTGGPPCQPFSFSGKRKGERDERNLWPEYFRVVREVRPESTTSD